MKIKCNWYRASWLVGLFLAVMISSGCQPAVVDTGFHGSGGSAVTPPPPLEIAKALPSARVGEAYSQAIAITGGTPPYVFTDYEGFPAGLNFDPVTGTVSGTPLAPNPSIIISVSVQDAGSPPQTQQADVTLLIKPLGVSITTDNLTAGTVNVAYSAQIQAINGIPPYKWQIGPAVGSLPNNLRLDPSTGVISGTPKTQGTSTFTVTVSDNDSPASHYSKEYTLTIQ